MLTSNHKPDKDYICTQCGQNVHGMRVDEPCPAASASQLINSTGYSHERYAQLLDRTFEEIKKLSVLKGGEYSGDVDRLLNFRRNGADLDLSMEVVWRVYAAKHWDAIGQYIRDLQSGKQRQRLESISGRVDDLLVYLLLFKAMIEERDQ